MNHGTGVILTRNVCSGKKNVVNCGQIFEVAQVGRLNAEVSTRNRRAQHQRRMEAAFRFWDIVTIDGLTS